MDDNKYLDYVMDNHLLGYADKDVNDAVTSQLSKGST